MHSPIGFPDGHHARSVAPHAASKASSAIAGMDSPMKIKNANMFFIFIFSFYYLFTKITL